MPLSRHTNRREAIILLGGAAAWPLAARAQQLTVPVIGFLHAGAPETNAHLMGAFHRGLSETGYVDGQNVAVEYRWAHNDGARLPDLAADLVRRRVAVIVTPIGTVAALAAKAATATIPIVFSAGTDPVQAGLVASLNRPGGNVTGIVNLNAELAAKRLGLLHELQPAATRIALMVNPRSPIATEAAIKDVQLAAPTIARHIEIFTPATNREIDAAFAALVQKGVGALLVNGADPFFIDRRVQFATLAARHVVPAIFAARDFADVGGLMSYGPNNPDRYRQVGIYTGRVLRGEKPADLPVLRASKFELVINLQTARALGLEVPPTLLARADEVIE
jgi:putative tryptophan/tyrosine transport system substrate-binding protein